MTPAAYVAAARCPPKMPTGRRSPWCLDRIAPDLPADRARLGAYADLTVLQREIANDRLEVVMEDSPAELRRHLPIWLRARGRVLITGLGLGCVVRGLLSNTAVTHVTVVELDPTIIGWVWPEFRADERLLLRQGDAFAMEWPPGTRFDYAWHDVWAEETPEPVLHGKLMVRYKDICEHQGAWGMPRWWRRLVGGDFT